MATLRHIAIRTADPEATAAWYRAAFGLTEVGRARNGVYLSDGDINIAILRLRTEHSGASAQPGLDHFGFVVDDLEVTARRLAAMGAERLPNAPLPGNEFEVKYRGPDGQVFDISAHGWAGARCNRGALSE
ncbi:MAG TPA: VOC family protein [Chloroflexota bacterium]|nr:VOC family protein [Chloroflexota bacterium]